MRVLDFGRSSVTFRIDLDRMPPRTLSHKPPYAMNNARVLLESRLRVTERATKQTHGFILGASCKTERLGAETDLWLLPNADFMPIFSDNAFYTVPPQAAAHTRRVRLPVAEGGQGA